MEYMQDCYSTQDIRNVLELLNVVLQTNDNYTIQRMEWVFGVPQLNIKIKDNNVPYLPVTSKFGDKLYKFVSPLFIGTQNECLLERVVARYSNMGDFLQILVHFFAMIYENPTLFIYFDSLPSTITQKNSLKEFIFYLSNEEIQKILNYYSSSPSNEKMINDFNNIIDKYNGKKLEIINKINNEVMDINSHMNNGIGNIKYYLNPKTELGTISKESISMIWNDSLNKKDVFLFMVDYETDIDKSTKEESKSITNTNKDIETTVDTKIDNFSSNNKDISITNEPLNEQDKFTTQSQSNTGMDIENAIDMKKSLENTNTTTKTSNSNTSNTITSSTKLNMQETKEITKLNETIRRIKESNEKIDEYANLKKVEESKEYNINTNNNTNNNNNNDTETKLKHSNSDENLNSGCRNKINRKNNNKNLFTTSQAYEDVFFKGLKDDFLQQTDMIFTRSLENNDSKTVNTIRRFILFNNSETEMKVELKFLSVSNNDEKNCYVTSSELNIVLESKKNFIINAYIFVKEDFSKEFDEIILENATCEKFTITNNNVYGPINNEEKKIHKSNSQDDLNKKINNNPGK